MIEVKLVRLALKLRNFVCRTALKSINKKSVKNLNNYEARKEASENMLKALNMYEVETENVYTLRESDIARAYSEVTQLAVK